MFKEIIRSVVWRLNRSSGFERRPRDTSASFKPARIHQNFDYQESEFTRPLGWSYRGAYKVKAQSETFVKEQIHNLPKAHVTYIYDGDTALVQKGWREKIVIRLDSIDCPEDGQYWGDIAKYGLMKLIHRKKVHIEEHGVDGYGRTLATLYVWHKEKNEWLNINERMVILGHAWVMRGLYEHLPRDRQAKLNRLEGWAKSKGVGLWHADNPIPPWRWRSGLGTE